MWMCTERVVSALFFVHKGYVCMTLGHIADRNALAAITAVHVTTMRIIEKAYLE